MASASETQRGDFAGRDLPEKNLVPVLDNPTPAQLNAARE